MTKLVKQALQLHARILGYPNTIEGIRDCLRSLYHNRSLSASDISKDVQDKTKIKIHANNIYYWLNKLNINKEPRKRLTVLDKSLKEKGYSSASEFFIKNASLTYEKMADILEVSSFSIKKEYTKFLNKD
jgi:hypothetical protein